MKSYHIVLLVFGFFCVASVVAAELQVRHNARKTAKTKDELHEILFKI